MMLSRKQCTNTCPISMTSRRITLVLAACELLLAGCVLCALIMQEFM